jgi:hypothetical protein
VNAAGIRHVLDDEIGNHFGMSLAHVALLHFAWVSVHFR